MAVEGRDVLVVGGGIAGLAAAAALARRGARVRVLEQAPELAEVGAGLQIGPNGVAVLEALGLGEAAARRASAPEAIELTDRGGRLVARVPMGAAALARHGRPYWQFHRADLLDLLEGAARRAGAEILLGARVARFETGDGAPRLRTEAGERFEADLVVAADGARSRARSALFGGGAPRYAGAVAWRALVPAERLARPHPPVTRLAMGPRRHVVSYPLRRGTLVNLVAIEERERRADEGWMNEGDPAELRAGCAGWAPEVTDLLGAVDRVFLWGLYDHEPLAEWQRDGVVMIGDACHPMLPFLAQGAGMGLEDAHVLACELDARTDRDAALAAFVARRRARAERVQRAAARNGRIYHLGAPGIRRAAHLGLALMSRLAPGRMLGRFDWLYGEDVTREG
ncbi:FAD-dependent oxidoreductase [Amaricoccus solimangrovi]|uniref:FAD-dependent oxidoreductase n=1 Tax=Amaricoccus solimangrovi TaxID=2589815 RepID=A0A501WTZ6_9RHOB|nr:FAD-dependent oxidoreductase [Amaricoccus solimangrovi]TPE53213.1 FAD-dependent oxidoreductase [Amaricoccus solimangrovi]